MVDETRMIGEAWARATRLSKDGQLHEATLGFLRLRALLREEDSKLRCFDATVPGGDTERAPAEGPASRGGEEGGAGMRAARAQASPTRPVRTRAVVSVIDKLLSKVDEEVRSHLRLLQSNPYAALQLPLPRGACASAAGAGAGASCVGRRSSDPSGGLAVTDALVKSNYRRLALRFHPDKTGGTDSSPLFAAIRTAYETIATFRDRALHKPPLSLRPTVSPDGVEFDWAVETAAVAAATASARGVGRSAAIAEVAPRGSANPRGGGRSNQEEQEEGRSRGRPMPPRKHAHGPANQNGSKDVSSNADYLDSCRGSDASAAAADPGRQRYGEGGEGRRQKVKQEKEKGPVGDKEKKPQRQQHQLGQSYAPQDCNDVEEGEKRESRRVGLDRRDDVGTSICGIGNDAAGTRTSATPRQGAEGGREDEDEDEEKEEEEEEEEEAEGEGERRQQEFGRRELTWESLDREESGGVLDRMARHDADVLLGRPPEARRPPGSSPAASFFSNGGVGSGVQQQRHHDNDQLSHRQPNPPISGRNQVDAPLEEKNSHPGRHQEPPPATEEACVHSSPLRPPSPSEETSSASPCFSSPKPTPTQPHPEKIYYPQQTNFQQLAEAAVCSLAVTRAPTTNVVADALEQLDSGGGDAWEGRNQAGRDGRIHEEALFLHEPFRGNRGTEARCGGSSYYKGASDNGCGGNGGGGGGVGVCGGVGCVRRLRERVTPKRLDHHTTCSSASYAYQLQQEVDFWVSGARREGVWRESPSFSQVNDDSNSNSSSRSILATTSVAVPVPAGGGAPTGGVEKLTPVVGHGAHRRRHHRLCCRRDALPLGSSGDSDSDDGDDDGDDAVDRLIRASSRNATDDDQRDIKKGNEMLLLDKTAFFSPAGGLNRRRANSVTSGARRSNRDSPGASATTMTTVVETRTPGAPSMGAATAAETAAVHSFEAGQGWFWGAPS